MEIRTLAGAAPAFEQKTGIAPKLKEAGQQFEAMLIGKILATARGADQDEGGQSSSAILDFAEQQVAQQISAHGGLGIAKMLMRQYEAKGK